MNLLPQYDFANHPVFKADRRLIRLGREHLQLASLQSDVIHISVAETISPLKIPIKYHMEYRIRSITGIDADQNPIYGDVHTLELALPELYPLEGCRITMLSDIWHPNIKSEGRFKGRVCGNSDGFGLNYDLYQLVLRVGEILQYKNYHAVHTPPYPEDSKVAQWVIEYAEPHGIVDKDKGIYVDDTDLIRVSSESSDLPEDEPPVAVAPPVVSAPIEMPPPIPVMPPPIPETKIMEEPPSVPPPASKGAIKITPVVKTHAEEEKKKFVIKPKI